MNVAELYKMAERLDKLERENRRAEKAELIQRIESLGYVAISHNVFGGTCYTIEGAEYAKKHRHI